MKLDALLAGVPHADVTTPPGVARAEVEVADVRDDSRLIAAGDMFVAIPGTAANGITFVDDAIARGACVVVVGNDDATAGSSIGAATMNRAEFRGTRVSVPRIRQALGIIAANRYGAADALALMAVTGTNGKTTTTYLLEAMLRAAGRRVGVVGTIAYRVGGGDGATMGSGRGVDSDGSSDGSSGAFSRAAPLTTPGALALHALFAEMRDAGASDVVLEASSHALEQGRLEGCRFRVAGLTNLTQDHLDYHGTMAAYFDAKAILFERLLDPRAGVAVLPIDRAEGRAMRARARAAGRATLAVSVQGQAAADVVVERVDASMDGLRVRLGTPLGSLDLASPLVGDFNLENLVLAVGMAVARGIERDAIVEGIASLGGVPGRLQRVPNQRGVLCVVDYAHTPDGLERALAAVRPLVAPGGRLIAVFGCGGDRDKTKRPLMGEAGARDADLAIITSDNPRTEDARSIIAMIVDGARRATAAVEIDSTTLGEASRGFCVIADRRAAISRAVAGSRAGDVLVLAGKGHEDYQIVGHERFHLDDREEAAAAFAAGARVGMERSS